MKKALLTLAWFVTFSAIAGEAKDYDSRLVSIQPIRPGMAYQGGYAEETRLMIYVGNDCIYDVEVNSPRRIGQDRLQTIYLGLLETLGNARWKKKKIHFDPKAWTWTGLLTESLENN